MGRGLIKRNASYHLPYLVGLALLILPSSLVKCSVAAVFARTLFELANQKEKLIHLTSYDTEIVEAVLFVLQTRPFLADTVHYKSTKVIIIPLF